jgi:hypothetical protein
MHLPPRRLVVAALTAAAIAAGAAGQAAADTPNMQGTIKGDAASAPESPSYEAPRPAGAGTGRKIG